MLAEIYSWFTEGFDTADLKDAKALLDELGDSHALHKVQHRQSRGRSVLREMRRKASAACPACEAS